MAAQVNEEKTFLLVTGASRGLGKAFSIALAGTLGQGSVIYLIARTENALIETQNEILENNKALEVRYFLIDQANAEKQAYVDMLNRIDPKQFNSAIIVHNSGSIGKQGQMVCDYDDKEELSSYYTLNVFSVMLLNSVFMKIFSSANKTIINISSLAALQPFVTWGNYCAGKAARDALFKVLAMEENEKNTSSSSSGDCKVLNYAPGPVHTTMIEDVIKDKNVHHGLKENFCNMIETKTILKPEQSAAKLVEILKENKFQSGDHVDYYD